VIVTSPSKVAKALILTRLVERATSSKGLSVPVCLYCDISVEKCAIARHSHVLVSAELPVPKFE
jgi:hypothetical protein